MTTFAIGRVMLRQMAWLRARLFRIGRLEIIVAVKGAAPGHERGNADAEL